MGFYKITHNFCVFVYIWLSFSNFTHKRLQERGAGYKGTWDRKNRGIKRNAGNTLNEINQ